jgi:hypothetical protein
VTDRKKKLKKSHKDTDPSTLPEAPTYESSDESSDLTTDLMIKLKDIREELVNGTVSITADESSKESASLVDKDNQIPVLKGKSPLSDRQLADSFPATENSTEENEAPLSNAWQKSSAGLVSGST